MMHTSATIRRTHALLLWGCLFHLPPSILWGKKINFWWDPKTFQGFFFISGGRDEFEFECALSVLRSVLCYCEVWGVRVFDVDILSATLSEGRGSFRFRHLQQFWYRLQRPNFENSDRSAWTFSTSDPIPVYTGAMEFFKLLIRRLSSW